MAETILPAGEVLVAVGSNNKKRAQYPFLLVSSSRGWQRMRFRGLTSLAEPPLRM